MLTDGQVFNPFGMFNGLFIPNCIAQSSVITDQEKILLGRLFQYAGSDGKAFPYRKTLADELAWSVVKLDRVIAKLKKSKLIKTFQESHNAATTYVFLFHDIYNNMHDKGRAIKNDRPEAIKNDNTIILNNHLLKSNTIVLQASPVGDASQAGKLGSKAGKALRNKLLDQTLLNETVLLVNHWNVKDSLTTHGLVGRRKFLYAEQSKTVQNINDSLKKLLAGTYYKNHDVPTRFKSKKFTIQEIKKSIDMAALARTPEYSPKPKKISFIHFIENQRGPLGKGNNLHRYKYPLIHFSVYAPTPMSNHHFKKGTEYEALVKKVMGKLQDNGIKGAKYNQIVTQVGKAVEFIESKANGNRNELVSMLPTLIYDALGLVNKGYTVEQLPLAVYNLEKLMRQRSMIA